LPRAEAAVGPRAPGAPETVIQHAVLCSAHDGCGPWAEQVLERRGLAGVRLVTAEEVVYSTRLVHRQDAGRVTTEITLSDGAVLGPGLRSVLNRIIAVPSEHLARTPEQDRGYALQELYALLTSVLASLPGVVNAAGPRGLPGPWLTEVEWLCRAARAGLPGVGYRSGRPASDRASPTATVLVIGSRVVPGSDCVVPASVATGCRVLAQDVGVEVLGVDFLTLRDTWLFVGANPTPDLRCGGEAAAEALADLMTTGRRP